jgi:hypothetical protein
VRAAERKLEQEQKRIELKATKEKETQNKAQAAFLRKLVADSQKCLTATYPVLLQLTTTQKETEFLELSKELQDGINASASALTSIKVEAQATTKHPFTYFSCVFQMLGQMGLDNFDLLTCIHALSNRNASEKTALSHCHSLPRT